MNNLLRNQKGLNDPEQYLSRLQHFSQGLGIPLDRAVSSLGSKSLWMDSRYDDPPLVAFHAHDEYSMLSGGQHWAAQGAVGDASKAGLKNGVGREINHRLATHVTALMDDDRVIRGDVTKHHFDPDTIASKWQQSNTNKFAHQSDFKPAFTDIESRWKEINRNRKVDSGILSAASNFLASPNPKVLRSMQSNHPEMFSSQFLGVNGSNNRDVIDLNTGNWAEIHPDGYFPT